MRALELPGAGRATLEYGLVDQCERSAPTALLRAGFHIATRRSLDLGKPGGSKLHARRNALAAICVQPIQPMRPPTPRRLARAGKPILGIAVERTVYPKFAFVLLGRIDDACDVAARAEDKLRRAAEELRRSVNGVSSPWSGTSSGCSPSSRPDKAEVRRLGRQVPRKRRSPAPSIAFCSQPQRPAPPQPPKSFAAINRNPQSDRLLEEQN